MNPFDKYSSDTFERTGALRGQLAAELARHGLALRSHPRSTTAPSSESPSAERTSLLDTRGTTRQANGRTGGNDEDQSSCETRPGAGGLPASAGQRFEADASGSPNSAGRLRHHHAGGRGSDARRRDDHAAAARDIGEYASVDPWLEDVCRLIRPHCETKARDYRAKARRAQARGRFLARAAVEGGGRGPPRSSREQVGRGHLHR